MNFDVNRIHGSAYAVLAALTLALALWFVISEGAMATPQFATATGKACLDCHTTPQGGAALTPFGEKFKANGNKLPH
jgi:hypothetical protein